MLVLTNLIKMHKAKSQKIWRFFANLCCIAVHASLHVRKNLSKILFDSDDAWLVHVANVVSTFLIFL